MDGLSKRPKICLRSYWMPPKWNIFLKFQVVGIDGRLVYETIIRPDDTIVDYNTRFSGVTARDLKRGSVKSLKDVQNDLLGFINANTILIGHGLENDLRALKVIYPNNYFDLHVCLSFRPPSSVRPPSVRPKKNSDSCSIITKCHY